MGAAHKACTNAFKACAKEKKESGSLLYACSQTVGDLANKAAQATANGKAIDDATKAIKDKISGRNGDVGLIRRIRSAPTTCAELIAAANTLIELAKTSPTSSLVAQSAGAI